MAKTSGMPCLALTDHHTLTGAIEFYDACLEAGIKPILGLEVNLASGGEESPAGRNLVLLAMDLRGWRSLCRISSLLESDDAILDFKTLQAEQSGLLCLTGGKRSYLHRLAAVGQLNLAQRWLSILKEVFTDRLYVQLEMHEAQDREICQRLEDEAKALHIPCVASHDLHYLSEKDAELQRIVAGIRLNQPVRRLSKDHFAPPNAGFKSAEDMRYLFQDHPQALARVDEIRERCHLSLPLGQARYPAVSLPEGTTAIQVLRQKAEKGAIQRYGNLNETIRKRLDHELKVIGEMGYAPLFLIMEQVIGYALSQGIPVSSRGSAASSLVAYCLGITTPDPLRLNLYFERFLNPARSSPPDIDTDLCSRRREEVIQFVYQQFGHERVATVCTVNRFRSRSALREVAKAFGLSPEEVSRLADSLPHRWWGPPRRHKEADPFQELRERFPQDHYQRIFNQAAALIGKPHHLSVHPGGLVISPGEMTDLVPTTMAAKGVRITQFDLESIERLGLVKIDLLGIRGLTVLGDVANALIEGKTRLRPQSRSATIDFIDSIPEKDEATSQLLRSGRTIGCFQIESPGMRATLREIQAASVDDLMVALALYRPGPLTGGLKNAFVRRHLGKETVEYLHPVLSGLLAETHGVILYQEQVLQLAHELVGFSLAEADLLRRAMSHFDPGKQMQTLKEHFIAGAAERHAIPEDISQQIWDQMAAFAGYGFPKAHAASYALLSWRLAWCKAHYPALLMMGVLANWGGYYPQRVYLTEARRLGLTLKPPHVNYAQREFSLVYQAGKPILYMGLDQVRDLTRRTQSAILEKRPFKSLAEFINRVDPRPMEVENLARAGALEGFGTIPGILNQLGKAKPQMGQLSFLAIDAPGSEEDWSLPEKVAAQEAILGVGVIAHPLELAQDKIRSAGAINTLEAASRVGEVVRVAGMRQTWRRSMTQRGDTIYFMALEDLEGVLDSVIFADVYQRYRAVFSDAGPYLIEGEMLRDEETGEPFIIVKQAFRLE